MMRTADRWMRVICGIAGSLGLIVASVVLFREGIAGITWLHGIRYLAVTFVCYVLLRVGIKGECPAWLDI